MQKKDFLEVNNPMLDWMLPYDAARAVLKAQPEVKDLTPVKFESVIDAFGGKQEEPEGTVLLEHGKEIDRLIVFITGNLAHCATHPTSCHPCQCSIVIYALL